jgi:hypothetical protein
MIKNDTQQFWETAWEKHLEQYLSAPPRTGYWLKQRLSLHHRNVLELAGGSCRDSRFLATDGINCTGSDFERKTLDYLASRFKNSPLKLKQADGFSLPFGKDEFYATFHNGFWVLFSDMDIKKLAIEQARITKRYMIILVHNKLNRDLVKTFDQNSKTDELYRIRFFEPDEVVNLVRGAGIPIKSIKIEKFGGTIDALYSPQLTGGSKLIQTFSSWVVPHLYRFQPWSKVERIACIIELDK